MLSQFVATWLRQQAGQSLLTKLSERPGEEEIPERIVRCTVCFPDASSAGGLVDRLQHVTTWRCAGFREHLADLDGVPISIIEAPVDRESLAHIVRDVIGLRKPMWILSAGFATALQTEFKRGSLVMASQIVDRDQYQLATGIQTAQSDPVPSPIRIGTLLAVDQWPNGSQAKCELGERYARFQPLACALQADVIAEVCRQLDTRMIGVHGIVELIDDDDRVTQEWNSQPTLAGKFGAAMGAFVAGPGNLRGMWNRKETELRVSDRMAEFIVTLIRQWSG